MNQFRTVLVGAALAAVMFAVASTADDKKPEEKAGNLIVNGSFEIGPDAGEFKPLDKDSTEIKGWTVTRAQIDYIGTYWQHAKGEHSLDLNGSPGVGGVSQTFKTTKGQKYRVSFALAGNPDGQVAKKVMGVKAAGKEAKFEFDTTGKTRTDMGWATKTWDFVADADETTLELFSLTTDDAACGPALDDVSVAPVKE